MDINQAADICQPIIQITQPRFKEIWCSQCGEGFGSGDHGFSHCEDHQGMISDEQHQIDEREWDKRGDAYADDEKELNFND